MNLFEPRRVLVTGGAGFIGGNFVRHLLESDPVVRIWNLDALTYAGNLESLADVDTRFGPDGEGRYSFVRADISDFSTVGRLLADQTIDSVVHFAAESHVDRSILGPELFVTTNVLGTFRSLEACRQAWAGRTDVRFHHVSTDEVFGSLGPEEIHRNFAVRPLQPLFRFQGGQRSPGARLAPDVPDCRSR